MTVQKSATLRPSDAAWPRSLTDRLGDSAPASLQVIGPVAVLGGRRTALFCSAKTPGNAILRAHDVARHMRDKEITVISGFHSPIEKECLHILLRGTQPIIICPARAIETMRIPIECRVAFEARRVLFVSPFIGHPTRVTEDSALRRNVVVAALADEAYVAHVSPGGQTARIAEMLNQWRVSIL